MPSNRRSTATAPTSDCRRAGNYRRLPKANGARSCRAYGRQRDRPGRHRRPGGGHPLRVVSRPGRRRAVADVLFGTASPSGKLPLTFPRSLDQLPPFDDYAMGGAPIATPRKNRSSPLALA